jgi:hypothetical protein
VITLSQFLCFYICFLYKIFTCIGQHRNTFFCLDSIFKMGQIISFCLFYRFQEDEVSLIVQLLTSHPPPSSAGVRFVSLGLCMLIACPSLIGQQEHEKRSIEWVQWLVREEAYFERCYNWNIGLTQTHASPDTYILNCHPGLTNVALPATGTLWGDLSPDSTALTLFH